MTKVHAKRKYWRSSGRGVVPVTRSLSSHTGTPVPIVTLVVLHLANIRTDMGIMHSERAKCHHSVLKGPRSSYIRGPLSTSSRVSQTCHIDKPHRMLPLRGLPDRTYTAP